MKNILQNKFILIIAMFIVFICISTSCFAVSSFNYNDNTFLITHYPDDGNQYHIIFMGFESNKNILFTSSSPMYCSKENSVSGSLNRVIGSDLKEYYFSYSSEDHIITDFKYVTDRFHNDNPLQSGCYNGYKPVYLRFADFDYTVVETGEVLFQHAPQTETEVEQKQTILAPIVDQKETDKTLQQILGILPIVIVVIISLIGLRKALRFLLTQLRQS